MKRTKIILYGKLVKLLGQKVFYAKLNNVGQVFSFLQANYPQLEDIFLKTNYYVKVGNRYVDQKNSKLKLKLMGIDVMKIDKQYEINLLFSDNRFITLYSEIIEVTLEDLKKK